MARVDEMIKICVIGNSHAASIKSGWLAISEYYPEVELTIYPFHGLYYETFTPVPDPIIATSTLRSATACS